MTADAERGAADAERGGADAERGGAGGPPGSPEDGSPKPALPQAPDPVFEDLVFRLLERREHEGDVALDPFCADHPEMAERLRARLRELHAGGLLGRPRDEPPPGSWKEVDLRANKDHFDLT